MSEPGTDAPPPPHPEPEEHPFAQAEQAGANDPLNGQITAGVDAANAAAANSAVLPEASLDQVIAQAPAGLAMLNAVNAQQNAYITANATVAAVVARILSADRPPSEPAPPPPEPPAPAKADHV